MGNEETLLYIFNHTHEFLERHGESKLIRGDKTPSGSIEHSDHRPWVRGGAGSMGSLISIRTSLFPVPC
jgi:hypothetical protein